MTTGKSKVVIGPKTGYPYPPDARLGDGLQAAGLDVRVDLGDTGGKGLLDLEITIANTADGSGVPRRPSPQLGQEQHARSYWAEAHTVPSPSGTRALFASDWGDSPTVDTYVLELPSYKPSSPSTKTSAVGNLLTP